MNQVDVLVVGAGPAGMAAAARAHESGARVAIADDNWSAGGQIWRGIQNSHTHTPAGIRAFWGTQVVDRGTGERTLLLEDSESAFKLAFDKLILSTGAREIYLPFPGWTLPGVMGAGGLQALVKSGLEIQGKSVVIAGSGPLLLAVAAYLHKAGARVKLIAEQATTKAVSSFAFHMVRYPQKMRQAAALKLSLHDVPYLRGCWVEAAEGEGRLRGVRLRQGRKTWMEDCDYAGVGYGLYPNTELASLLGCRLRANAIEVDEWQRTSLDGVFAAGESTGIGGVDLSLVEGEIAGYAACGEMRRASRLFGMRSHAKRFAGALDRAFRLREELQTLPCPGTIICRCEDVPYEKLQQMSSFRAAKLHTRCGMGPCQARICGVATEFLFGWRTDSVRPPILPARAASLVLRKEFQQESSTTFKVLP
ncbi:MAG TPA: FAD-dependent oxidoreductase [Bryobacteraceae bacterium]|jgi:NADPH-dependent 2,4-dienoyl-CoA reductase/sulfur reductase-like enzyme